MRCMLVVGRGMCRVGVAAVITINLSPSDVQLYLLRGEPVVFWLGPQRTE